MDIKNGDEVIVYLDEEIMENEKKKSRYHHLIKFWKDINGKVGIVTSVVSDDEIWVRGGRTGVERMFNKTTLRKLDLE